MEYSCKFGLFFKLNDFYYVVNRTEIKINDYFVSELYTPDISSKIIKYESKDKGDPNVLEEYGYLKIVASNDPTLELPSIPKNFIDSNKLSQGTKTVFVKYENYSDCLNFQTENCANVCVDCANIYIDDDNEIEILLVPNYYG